MANNDAVSLTFLHDTAFVLEVVSVEAVDVKDLVSSARTFDLAAPDALEHLADFAKHVITNISVPDFLARRMQSLTRGTDRNPPTDVEKVALEFVRSPSRRAAIHLLGSMSQETGVRTIRPTVLRAGIKALQLCESRDGQSFHEATIRMRDQYRILERPLPRRAVGSTLLMKGLEADVAVILNADALDTRNLYVAMPHGAHPSRPALSLQC